MYALQFHLGLSEWVQRVPYYFAQFQHEEDRDEVAQSSQHTASGSAKWSSNSRPTNAYSLSSKITSAKLSEI